MKKLTKEGFEEYFSIRSYNKINDFDENRESFIDDFFNLSLKVEEVLQRYSLSPYALGKGDYVISDYYSDARFIEVSFMNDLFMSRKVIKSVQELVRSVNEGWMVCIWHHPSYIFITKELIEYWDDSRGSKVRG